MINTTCKHCGTLIYGETLSSWYDAGVVWPQFCSTEEPLTQQHEPHLWHTQGGGTVVYDNIDQQYIFVVPPPGFPNIEQGDPMPNNWSIS